LIAKGPDFLANGVENRCGLEIFWLRLLVDTLRVAKNTEEAVYEYIIG